MSDEPKVKSLYKALCVLECFLEGDPIKGVSEIAQYLDLPKSTVSNILSTYVMMDFIELDKRSGKYKLGLRALELSNRTYQMNDTRKIMQPYMEEFATYTGEEVLLAVRRDNEVVYVGSVSVKEGLSRRYVIGTRAPMYCTGIGKAMLFQETEKQVRSIFENGVTKFTDNTIQDFYVFMAHLEELKAQGYSVDNMEHEYGIRCVAVPIYNQAGAIVAGMSISGPSLRMEDDHIREYGERLKAMSKQVSRLII